MTSRKTDGVELDGHVVVSGYGLDLVTRRRTPSLLWPRRRHPVSQSAAIIGL
jgi:hypothetical protein